MNRRLLAALLLVLCVALLVPAPALAKTRREKALEKQVKTLKTQVTKLKRQHTVDSGTIGSLSTALLAYTCETFKLERVVEVAGYKLTETTHGALHDRFWEEYGSAMVDSNGNPLYTSADEFVDTNSLFSQIDINPLPTSPGYTDAGGVVHNGTGGALTWPVYYSPSGSYSPERVGTPFLSADSPANALADSLLLKQLHK